LTGPTYPDARAFCRRLPEWPPGAPGGLRHVASWVEVTVARCFQLIEGADARVPRRWVAFRGDPVEFESVPAGRSPAIRATFQPSPLDMAPMRRQGSLLTGRPRAPN
jgi:hypothetical protein